jgi:hypothetical protein
MLIIHSLLEMRRSFLPLTVLLLCCLSSLLVLVSGRVSPRLDAPTCSTSTQVRLGRGSTAAAPVTVQIDSWGHDSIRVRMSPSDIQQIPDVQALLPFPPGLTPPRESPCQVNSQVMAGGVGADLTNGNLQVTVDMNGVMTAKRVSDGARLIQTTSTTFDEVKLQSIYPSN